MDKFQENIKDWVKVDEQIKEMNENIKELRGNKNVIQADIYTFVKENELESSIIKISDGRLKFTQLKQNQSLSLSYIESCLRDKIHDENTVMDLMQHIKDKRVPKYSNEINRYYD